MTQRISITRVFNAPREEVWLAWTEPERIAQWWGKRGWSTPVSSVELDVRPGGVFRERLVFGTTSVTFVDLGDGRTEMQFEATVSADVAAGGLASAFDRLEESL